MPAAIAIPAIIGGASALGGAAISAHAAGKAEKAQVQSTDKALALQRDIYGKQLDLVQPYVQGGASAFNRLMDGYWNNRPYGMTAPQGAGAVPGAAPVQAPPAFGQAFGQPAQGAPVAGPAGGGLVTVRSPDGETRRVPMAMAERMKAAGGQVMA